MQVKQAGLLAAAIVLAAPAFAQTAVQSASGITVNSGTGVIVTPGVSTAVVAPVPTVAVIPSPAISGAVVAQAGTTESVSGNARTTITRYWVNVPAGVERDADFQRWQRLR